MKFAPCAATCSISDLKVWPELIERRQHGVQQTARIGDRRDHDLRGGPADGDQPAHHGGRQRRPEADRLRQNLRDGTARVAPASAPVC